jgi:hypothetical protein
MRIRGSRLSSAAARWTLAAAVASGLACGRAPEAVSPTPSSAEGSPSAVTRAPDGVVIDAPALLPPSVARSGARGVVSLREPQGQDVVIDLVRTFLEGWQHESLDTLLSLVSPDAGLIDGPDHGHATLVESWRQRLKAHDYGRLAGAELVLPERIERWEWDELGAPAKPARPSAMRPGEILVRAALEVTRVAGERVFGDVVTMILRRQGGTLRIAGYGEGDPQ